MSAFGTARGRYRDALRHRDLRLLMTAFLIDQIGSWSYLIVISVYIFDRTHSTQWLAALAVCRWGPSLPLASYGGVLADRYQRVTVLVVSALASAVLMAGMTAVVATAAPVGFVLAISALSSVAGAPYQPAAGALTPEVAGILRETILLRSASAEDPSCGARSVRRPRSVGNLTGHVSTGRLTKSGRLAIVVHTKKKTEQGGQTP